MSQCFSGGFAELSTGAGPPGVCGYFSSTADRPAYGCFPENVGKERVGHSFHFLSALASDRRMSEAHAESLVDDDTPDVPLRSSDALLAQVLRKGAEERSVSVEALAADLLGKSWRDHAAWQTERALADRIAGEYGMVSPRSLADIEAQRDELLELGRALGVSARAWGDALNDAAGDNLDKFVAANPVWKERLSDEALKALDADAARKLTAALLAELAPWTRRERGDRLDVLEHKREEADEAEYRTEVRIAVALRLQVLLTSMAARSYLDAHGSQAQRDEYAALRGCEDLTLPGGPVASAAGASNERELTVFPPISDERKLEHEVHPSWLGITFGQVRDDLRAEHALPSGVSLVTGVYPMSPAKLGGIQVGDLIVGAPGAPFTARNEVRSWTMLSSASEPHPLEIVRDGKEMLVSVALRPHPGAMPPPPPPDAPAIGAAAPPVSLRRYRGADVNLKDGRSHLLLFWATWCGPCKASLPEVLAYERERNTQVVAITDEAPATLDAFFAHWKDPFPKTVAIDDLRTSFMSYAITGTPGFVLIDGKGNVKARGIGYGRPQGLPIEGWKWKGNEEKRDKGAKSASEASGGAKHADVLGLPQGPHDHAQ
jgi:thiol-disulfide isomerase/thioredoxin